MSMTAVVDGVGDPWTLLRRGLRREHRLALYVRREDPFGLADALTFPSQIIPRRIAAVSESLDEGARLPGEDARVPALQRLLCARAVLRDLGMHVAAAARLGTQPAPAEIDLLLRAGAIADQAPRDTVYSYAYWNPPSRRRLFSDLPAEAAFVDNVDVSIRHLTIIALALCEIRTGPPTAGAALSKALSAAANELMRCMIAVSKSVTPAQFTHQLRPFFDPIRVGEESYLGPGGAQLPVTIVDILMFGHAATEPSRRLLLENLIYMPPGFRLLAEYALSYECGEQLQIRTESSTDHELIAAAVRSAARSILSFRRVHLKVAMANFALRTGSAVGSGGYRPDVLHDILAQQEAAIAAAWPGPANARRA
jgi:hypothetical protein